MAFTKAKIKVFGDGGKTKEIPVLFNPAEYNLTAAANYSEKSVPGLDGPITQFISGAAYSLSMTLMFDTYETSPAQAGANVAAKSSTDPVKPTDVSLLTREITKLTTIDGTLHAPPLVQFIWGSLSFKGVITQVNQSYTMFMEDGMPVRAKLDVTFQSVLDVATSKKASPFESPDRTKCLTIEQGMQIWNLAWQEYGDPEMWRVIAKANGIMNPRLVYPGQIIKLPAM